MSVLDECSGVPLPYHSIQRDSRYVVVGLHDNNPGSVMVDQRLYNLH